MKASLSQNGSVYSIYIYRIGTPGLRAHGWTHKAFLEPLGFDNDLTRPFLSATWLGPSWDTDTQALPAGPLHEV